MPHRAVLRCFVDRCQAAILDGVDGRTAEAIKLLEDATRALWTGCGALPRREQDIARTETGRILFRVLHRHQLDSDPRIAVALSALICGDSFGKDDCERLFGLWFHVLTQTASIVDPRVKRVVKFIRRGYASRKLTLERASKLAGVSPGYLEKMLKHSTGMRFQQLKRLARIDAAAHLLERTGLSMKQIAAAVGYADRSELPRDFSRIHGLSPTVYRRTKSATK